MSEGIDNQAHRITTLKHIITHLHEGHAPGQVRQQLSEIVRQTDPSEVEPPPGRAAKIARPKPMLPKKKRGGG